MGTVQYCVVETTASKLQNNYTILLQTYSIAYLFCDTPWACENWKMWGFKSLEIIEYNIIQLCSGITCGRVLNGELYAQRS